MKCKFLILRVLWCCLVPLFLWTACDDDHETLYEAYGLICKTNSGPDRILLDDGTRLQVRESAVNLKVLDDSTRIYLHFSIWRETDTCDEVRVTYCDPILTKSVLPYDESVSDSLGHDPVKITKAWFAHGFLNFEFVYAGRYHIGREHAHMVNLLQCQPEDGVLAFEFRHNDFGDNRDRIYMGVVSFPMKEVVSGLAKPVKMKVRFNDFQDITHSIDLSYE